MWTNLAPLLLLMLAAWVGTALFMGARRYTFKPYYIAVVACGLVAAAAVGSIITIGSPGTGRLYERVLWTGMFLFMASVLLARKEELRRGIDTRKILLFQAALPGTGAKR